MRFIILAITFLIFSMSAYAQEIAPSLEIVAVVLKQLLTMFPKAGPIVQTGLEIIGGLATFFTLATVFVVGCLKIPYLAAKISGSEAMAQKIQKFSDKVSYYLKYASIFNAKKK